MNESKLGALVPPKAAAQAKLPDNNQELKSPRSSIFTLQEIGSDGFDDNDFVFSDGLSNKK